MVRTILVTLIFLCSADILLANSKYTQTGMKVMGEIWNTVSR